MGVIGLLLFALLLLAGVTEVCVRLRSPHGHFTPDTVRTRELQYQPAVFARHVFPRREQAIIGHKGTCRYYINALGYRGKSFSVAKPPHLIRVMVYGGSAAFDGGAPLEKHWPQLVEARLRDSGLQNVEVINAGIPGLASFDSVGRLFAEGHLFDPNYVLLYAAWNDIKDFVATEPLLRLHMPDVWPDQDAKTTYRNRVDRLLCDVSQLYVRVRDRYYSWKYRVEPEPHVPARSYASTLSDTALRQYKMNVQTFVDVARNAGAKPVLVSHARLVARSNTAEQRNRIAYDLVLLTHDALCDAFEATDRIMREVAAEKGAVFIDASSGLSGREELYLDHVHFNELGSNALADVVATSMASLLRPTPAIVPAAFSKSHADSNVTIPAMERPMAVSPPFNMKSA